jgi:hypothetical protein
MRIVFLFLPSVSRNITLFLPSNIFAQGRKSIKVLHCMSPLIITVIARESSRTVYTESGPIRSISLLHAF